MKQQNIAVFAIPARLPDLNLIENLFNQININLDPLVFVHRTEGVAIKYTSIGFFVFQKSDILCYQLQHDNYIPN